LGGKKKVVKTQLKQKKKRGREGGKGLGLFPCVRETTAGGQRKKKQGRRRSCENGVSKCKRRGKKSKGGVPKTSPVLQVENSEQKMEGGPEQKERKSKS